MNILDENVMIRLYIKFGVIEPPFFQKRMTDTKV